ncbi:hypothetical protein EH30_00145 [Erythrobacter sp. JL475]|nr:hypothetical protein EH30_00145 [Erythrobacter sp. JL475]
MTSTGIVAADAEAARFLLRASFSASVAEIEAVKQKGRSAWLRSQMTWPNDQSATDYVRANGFDEVNSDREFASDRNLDRVIWHQLLTGGNSVRKRVAFALSQFFVVSNSPRLRMWWPTQAFAAFWDTLNEHAFGNFRDLLEAVCLSPVMGVFLDTIGSRKDDEKTGRVPDENFARELMQLFSIGLFELNLDGSNRLQNGEPIETYTNSDVAGLARAFTGYDVDMTDATSFPDPANPNRIIPGVQSVRQPMTANPSNWPRPESESQHSLLEKRFLGVAVPPGTGPRDTLRMALDTLFNHPNVGPFFAKQMIQRLVTSNPTPDYVRRVASVFNDNGAGVRGDLAAVFEAILVDEDAYTDNSLNDFRFGKLREPVVRFVQFARSFRLYKSDSVGVTRDLSDNQKLLSQSPFRARSVFGFFRPNYVPPRSVTAANDMFAPEFQVVEETSIAAYVNFIVASVDGRGFWLNDLQPDYTYELGLSDQPEALINHLDLVLTAGQLRSATRDAIFRAVSAIDVLQSDPEDGRTRRVHTAVALTLCSNDFMIQK